MLKRNALFKGRLKPKIRRRSERITATANRGAWRVMERLESQVNGGKIPA